jgi:D-alanyl-D-alanine carboxypeptidase (penicillin-binding protein 5/6)
MYFTKRTFYFLAVFILFLLCVPRISRFMDERFQASEVTKPAGYSFSGAPIIEKTLSPNETFPAVSAEAILIADFDTGEVIFGKAEYDVFPIASLSKLMTSLLFTERMEESHEYVIPAEAKQAEGKQSQIPGEARITGDAIISLMLIESDNDIAETAAEKIGKEINVERGIPLTFSISLETAVTRMNEEAYRLGMRDTNFMNPTGIDHPGHYSTPHDLFILMRQIWDEAPEIWRVSRKTEEKIAFRRTYGGKIEYVSIKNTNPLLVKYPRVIGSKTGTTDNAREAVVMAYRMPTGRNIAIIILKSENRFEDAEKIIKWLSE